MTPKAQRISILVIAIVMVVGTLGSFAMLILANDNAITEQDQLAKQYQEMIEQQQKEAKILSDAHYPTFQPFEDRAVAFDTASVGDTVTTVDLVEGSGEAVTGDTVYRVYYMGWNPKGKVFDSSLNETGDGLKDPLTHQADGVWDFGGQTGGVIEGWTLGIAGMKIGGIRELTIPSDFAYKDQDRGADIPPNTPLKFIIMLIPAAEVQG